MTMKIDSNRQAYPLDEVQGSVKTSESITTMAPGTAGQIDAQRAQAAYNVSLKQLTATFLLEPNTPLAQALRNCRPEEVERLVSAVTSTLSQSVRLFQDYLKDIKNMRLS